MVFKLFQRCLKNEDRSGTETEGKAKKDVDSTFLPPSFHLFTFMNLQCVTNITQKVMQLCNLTCGLSVTQRGID